MQLKKTYTIIAFVLTLLAFVSCHKDKEFGSEKPEVGEVEVSSTLNQADFTWKVSYPGKFQTGVEISDNEALDDSRTVEGTKDGEVFKARVGQLEASTKYYYRIVVWNKVSRQEGEVKSFTTTDPEYTITVAAHPQEGGSVTGGGTFHYGESCTVKATANSCYTFLRWTENGSEVYTDASYTFVVTSNRTLVANFEQNFPVGAINGLFTINDNGDQVYFSQGNLQYIGSASTPYWKFADNQWEFFGNNGQGSDSQTVDRDLFGWGTSGFHDSSDPYNVNYQPWATSQDKVDSTYNSFGYGPSTNMPSLDLTGSSAYYDWGVYNRISNGGNTTDTWRTLTGGRDNGEWRYVFDIRSASTVNGVANARYAKAKVADVYGVILFPDNYTHPEGVTLPIGINQSDDVGWNGNNYSAENFLLMQAVGAVFLPAAGYREGTSVGSVGSHYWSASYYSGFYACCGVYFKSSILWAVSYVSPFPRSLGQSVRLVCPAE